MEETPRVASSCRVTRGVLLPVPKELFYIDRVGLVMWSM